MRSEQRAAAENRLFGEWKKIEPLLVRDGAGRDYAAQKRQLLFILKEPNDPDGSWALSGCADLRTVPTWDFLSTEYRRSTWDTIATWAACIFEEDASELGHARWKSLLRRIAVVNLKKTGGGGTAEPRRIRKFIKSGVNRRLLKRQLGFYRPDVTICGGDLVWVCLEDLLNWDSSKYKQHKCKTTDDITLHHSDDLGLVISFWHPAQYGRNHSEILQVLKEITVTYVHDHTWSPRRGG